MNIAGHKILVLNSKKAIEDLLVVRSPKYSTRTPNLLADKYLFQELFLPIAKHDHERYLFLT
jgi:hypothetical protein